MEFNTIKLVVVRVASQDRVYKTCGPLVSRESVFYEEGSALCRLERSTLPQHAGRRIVVMRLLKILRPPKRYLELPQVPAEGELFKSWCRDVDKPGKCGETLRLLYDGPDSIKQVSDWSS
ncbi:hypothetical protein EWM64_g5464 [Hericium alpestre]|uniref:Uncharacterized protein n=1 Tax=Hericium alpestre TaxID=135208 RepID=A0A4Y9ZUT8_9AGAM|nr:hypothetical protein EWM64_g5464 [Hericium alpestre]